MIESAILVTNKKISLSILQKLCENWFGDMVKVVVDIETEEIALGGELHADAESILLEKGSLQRNVWGANIYPENQPGKQIEFTALINIRPHQDNPSMQIGDEALRNKVHQIIKRLIPIEG